MDHESTWRPATRGRERLQQAIRPAARRRRIDNRALYALVGALLVASVTLVGQARGGEGGSSARPSAPEGTDISASAIAVSATDSPVHFPDELVLETLAPSRRDGDVSNAIDPPAEHSLAAPAARATGPTRPVAWYRLAAAEYGVSVQLLEALHQVESNASPDACIANLEGSGAIGPFQFKPATFAMFGVDANHDGVTDICGFVDSLFSAARYLHAIGADGDPSSKASRRALARYGTDVERVVSLARAYQERDGLVAMASATTRQ